MINKKRIVNTFIELSQVDGIHGNEKVIANILTEKLKKLNCTVTTDEASKSLVVIRKYYCTFRWGEKYSTNIPLCTYGYN